MNLRVPDPTAAASLSLFKSNEEVLAKRARPAEGSPYPTPARPVRPSWRPTKTSTYTHDSLRQLHKRHGVSPETMAETFGLPVDAVAKILAGGR